jgi:hypothetical protein
VIEAPDAAAGNLTTGTDDELLRRRQPLRAASWYRMQAKIAVNREREALESWDPAAFGNGGHQSVDPEAWRLSQMALDRSGDLHRARALALRAAALARGPDEAYRAVELLVLVEHELGHHRQELQQARNLVALRPRSQRSLMILRRAAGCSGLKPLQCWAARQLDLLQGEPDPTTVQPARASGPPF